MCLSVKNREDVVEKQRSTYCVTVAVYSAFRHRYFYTKVLLPADCQIPTLSQRINSVSKRFQVEGCFGSCSRE
ncbi:hypothetical protein B9Z55_025287 [Caenorhabditis nigoni]|uniref:Uncharacterized protein n=1 Tax=Caenorhabditis nigoni TaxID=1611254 RepID=A0A2G5SY15_9PELO|nr:hypothetical protein B9Z55_025287 [Caenorhabditis nigoni]